MNLRGLAVALQFFTTLPAPTVRDYVDNDLARSAVWLPTVGLLIGSLVAAAIAVSATVSPVLAALLGLIVWVRVTGGLHLDGLADASDGLAASHRQPDRFLKVARDPNIGAFGVIAICLVIAAKIALIAIIVHDYGTTAVIAIVLVPAWARWIALTTAWALPAIDNGRAATFKGGLTPTGITVNAAMLTIASGLTAPGLVIAVLLVVGAVAFWQSRLGGLSGDCLGATIEVSEATLLVATVVGLRFGLTSPLGWLS
ncbi:MAG: adenosylcobinamide-GDP ribazoletransferase [Pseudomonadota bacterium]